MSDYNEVVNEAVRRIRIVTNTDIPEGERREELDIEWTCISDELIAYLSTLSDDVVERIIEQYGMSNVQRVYESYDESIEGKTIRDMVYQIMIGRVERIFYHVDVTDYDDGGEPF